MWLILLIVIIIIMSVIVFRLIRRLVRMLLLLLLLFLNHHRPLPSPLLPLSPPSSCLLPLAPFSSSSSSSSSTSSCVLLLPSPPLASASSSSCSSYLSWDGGALARLGSLRRTSSDAAVWRVVFDSAEEGGIAEPGRINYADFLAAVRRSPTLQVSKDVLSDAELQAGARARGRARAGRLADGARPCGPQAVRPRLAHSGGPMGMPAALGAASVGGALR